MTEPTYNTTTERLYKRLPEIYRILDATTNTYENTANVDYPFKTFLSGIIDILGEIDTTVERLKYVTPENRNEYASASNIYNTYVRPAGLEDAALGYLPLNETSDLFDGRTADEEWLPWLGKLIGVKADPNEAESVKRDKVIFAYEGFKAGSKQSMGNAVKEVLSGSKFTRVFDHSTVVSGFLTPSASEWDVVIMTKTPETPAGFDLAATVIAKGAKPAGVVLYYLAYTLYWDALESALANWTAIEATLNWDTLETSGAEAIPE